MPNYFKRLLKLIQRKISKGCARKYQVTRQKLGRNIRRRAASLRSIDSRISTRAIKLLGIKPYKELAPRQDPLDKMESALSFCKTFEDVEMFRLFLLKNPDYLEDFGVPTENNAFLLEELCFFVDKCIQLKAAEERISNQRKAKKKRNVDALKA